MTDHPHHPSRRDVLKAGAAGLLGAGYALAVQPVSAETIHTPDDGLVTANKFLDRGGAQLPYYLARPKGAGPFPTVIVIHEIFGLHEYIRDIVRRFAREGFLAAAAELYLRQGDVKGLAAIDEILEIVRKVPDRQMLDDLGALLTTVKALPECNGKIGTTGFCWGGGATWLFVADNPSLSAGVAWYGRMTNWSDGSALHPKNPVELAAQMNAPVLGLYGGQDAGIPVAQVDAMKAALTQANKPHDFKVYPDAPHGFHADYRPSYRADAAKDGWSRCVGWFRKYLV
jgi:carboxymethylenebutenolidase